MKCNYCNVEITYPTDVCPLCHMPLPGAEAPLEPERFPGGRAARARKHFTPSAEKLYVYCALHIFALSVLLNLRFAPHFWWAAIVFVLAVAGFLVMKAVLNSKSKLHIKHEKRVTPLGAYLKRFFHI